MKEVIYILHKSMIRPFAFLLALIALVSILTPTVCAISPDDAEEARIYEQIKTLYKQTLRGAKMSSLHGYCGTMVSWHLYLLGITTEVVGNDGNTQYDYYSKQEYTSGGYRVRTYSAIEYTLEEALKAASCNGTKDIYNLVVCFDRTNTAAGRKYGHALVIHAIIDGMVYFSESFSSTFNGKYYAEGSPIIIPIADFAKYYAPWTTFEGVLYFGLGEYIDRCTEYPSYLYATTIKDSLVYTEPCDTQTNSCSMPVHKLTAGYHVEVTGLYFNTIGEYWYRIADGGAVGYVLAETLKIDIMCYDDIKIDSFAYTLPLHTMDNLSFTGTVQADYNKIVAIRTQLFSLNTVDKKYISCKTDSVQQNTYDISDSKIVPYERLTAGRYQIELAVVVGNYYYADSHLQTEWKTIKLFVTNFGLRDANQLKNQLRHLKRNKFDRIYQRTMFDIYDRFIFNKFIFAKLYDCFIVKEQSKGQLLMGRHRVDRSDKVMQTFESSRPLVLRLKEAAQRKNITVSALIREILEKHFENRDI